MVLWSRLIKRFDVHDLCSAIGLSSMGWVDLSAVVIFEDLHLIMRLLSSRLRSSLTGSALQDGAIRMHGEHEFGHLRI